MNMKKWLTITTLSVFFVGSTAYANENEEETSITPEDELYDTSLLIEETELAFTEDQIERALLLDEFADDRLSEIEVLVEAGNLEEAETLLEEYQKYLDSLESELEEKEPRCSRGRRSY